MCDCAEIQHRTFVEGDYYAGRKGKCEHKNFWKQFGKRFKFKGKSGHYWRKLPNAQRGEITICVADDDGIHNYQLNCGCPRFEKLIWLPRQDQLQEMFNRTTWHLEQSFHYFFLERSKIKGNSDKRTMEQLWLAFVMDEKFNKIWNKDKWDET